MTADLRVEKNLQGFLRKISPSKAVERFLSGYGNDGLRHLRFLEEKRNAGVRDGLGPLLGNSKEAWA